MGTKGKKNPNNKPNSEGGGNWEDGRGGGGDDDENPCLRHFRKGKLSDQAILQMGFLLTQAKSLWHGQLEPSHYPSSATKMRKL